MFSVMTILVTIIAAIIATRFIYIDRQYASLIDRQNAVAEKLEMADAGMAAEHLDEFKGLQKASGHAASRRDNNRKDGLILDVMAMLAILILGMLTTFGVFGDPQEFLLLNVLLAVWFSIPLVNFMRHVFYIQKEI